MKSLQKSTFLIAVFSVLFLGLSTISTANNKEKGDKEENIESLNGQFEKAVSTRHFDSAKDAVNKMLPLMKKDIKESKKLLSNWDKSSNDVELDKETFAAQLNKNNEIYASIKGLVSSSPAAIRVKGKQLVEKLNNYISLVNR